MCVNSETMLIYKSIDQTGTRFHVVCKQCRREWTFQRNELFYNALKAFKEHQCKEVHDEN